MPNADHTLKEDIACIVDNDGTSSKTIDKSGQVDVEIKIGPEGLTATACVKPTMLGTGYSLEDLSFARDLIKEEMVEEDISSTVDPCHVQTVLRSHGIFVGIDAGAIAAFAANPTDVPQVVARGIRPTSGQDAYIEFKFEQEAMFCVPTDDSQKIDWRKLTHIPTVKVGDELAVKHSLRLGKPGLSVTGEVLVPPVAKDVELRGRRGL